MGDSFRSGQWGVDHMGKLLPDVQNLLLRTNIGVEEATSISSVSHKSCFHLLALVTFE